MYDCPPPSGILMTVSKQWKAHWQATRFLVKSIYGLVVRVQACAMANRNIYSNCRNIQEASRHHIRLDHWKKKDTLHNSFQDR